MKLFRFVVSLLLVGFSASCASSGSNARKFDDEQFQATLVHSPSRANFSSSSIDQVLFVIGDAVVKKVIDYTAEQYTQDSKVVLELKDKTAINGKTQSSYVVITRTYPQGGQMPRVEELGTSGGLGRIFSMAKEEQDAEVKVQHQSE